MISGRCLHNGSKDRTKERWGKKFHGYQKPPGEIVDDYAKRFKIVMLWLYGGYMEINPAQMTVLRQFLIKLDGEIQRPIRSVAS
jgi:hypothetical protein